MKSMMENRLTDAEEYVAVRLLDGGGEALGEQFKRDEMSGQNWEDVMDGLVSLEARGYVSIQVEDNGAVTAVFTAKWAKQPLIVRSAA